MLLTDPGLIYDKCLDRSEGFENALSLFHADYNAKIVQPQLSGIPMATRMFTFMLVNIDVNYNYIIQLYKVNVYPPFNLIFTELAHDLNALFVQFLCSIAVM